MIAAPHQVQFLVHTSSLQASTLSAETARSLYEHLGIELEVPNGWIDTARVVDALVDQRCMQLVSSNPSQNGRVSEITQHLQQVVLAYMLGHPTFSYIFQERPMSELRAANA